MLELLQSLFWGAFYLCGTLFFLALGGAFVRIMINLYTQAYAYLTEFNKIKRGEVEVQAPVEATPVMAPPIGTQFINYEVQRER